LGEHVLGGSIQLSTSDVRRTSDSTSEAAQPAKSAGQATQPAKSAGQALNQRSGSTFNPKIKYIPKIGIIIDNNMTKFARWIFLLLYRY